jgi:hypothetical protein
MIPSRWKNVPARWVKRGSVLCLLLTALMLPIEAKSDGLSVVKSCETDRSPPEEIARLTILPNGECRGSATAAALIQIARQKAKEGKEEEAIRWALLCEFDTREQDAIRRHSAAVIRYLQQ